MEKEEIRDWILGEDPTIETVLDVALESGDTMVIEIRDPSNNVVVDDVAMTEVNSRVYQYVFATETTDTAGLYTATIKANNGEGDDYDRVYLNMVAYS